MDSCRAKHFDLGHVVPTQRKRKLVSSKARGGEDRIKRARLSPCSTADSIYHALYTHANSRLTAAETRTRIEEI